MQFLCRLEAVGGEMVQGVVGGNQLQERGGAHQRARIKSRDGREWTLEVACGVCGIAQHPTGRSKSVQWGVVTSVAREEMRGAAAMRMEGFSSGPCSMSW